MHGLIPVVLRLIPFIFFVLLAGRENVNAQPDVNTCRGLFSIVPVIFLAKTNEPKALRLY